ncbi:MAG TPA: pentapeptide repeat-containing protein [Abditibacterium sp.]|jgi:uncharacterized protein YjbI with pentapeptide repeats
MPSILSQRAAARDASARYTRSLELLSAANPTERLAGIYGLEGLLREERGNEAPLSGAIIEVFSAFVRRHASPDVLGVSQRLSVDVQAALTALGRTPDVLAQLERPLDLHGINLREAYLPRCHFERAFLYDCDFEGALLIGANLRGAWLSRANLTRANLDGADLRGADLTGARGLNPSELQDVQWDETTRWPQPRDFRETFQPPFEAEWFHA